ncbi:MAG: hypothetical protein HKP30_13915, partial [Myxococcales bacterium]|nr:hypothetical protein [Myxococcales bacterium]
MAPRLAARLIAVLLCVGLAGPAAAVDLEGSWHVLVHYTDASAANPEAERWDDRVWLFKREGDRLRWIEYPIVIFDDESGRFERAGTNRASRVLHFWEPDEGQLAEIRRGLQFNPRGARNKSLRGSDAQGWSTGGGGAYQSARFLSYTELWQV